MPMINVEQGSDEWLSLRRSHITATDISVIMGTNPFKTKRELWREKMGLSPPQETNAAMERGQRLEPEARSLASKILEIDFTPVVMTSLRYPWAMASLDGLSDEYELATVILEIKCPKLSTHMDTYNRDYIAEYYYDQMQWQMLVSEAAECYYCSYRPECQGQEIAIIPVQVNQIRQEEMLEEGYKFYQSMCNFDEPEDWTLQMRA